jgi:hypothetical protein
VKQIHFKNLLLGIIVTLIHEFDCSQRNWPGFAVLVPISPDVAQIVFRLCHTDPDSPCDD